MTSNLKYAPFAGAQAVLESGFVAFGADRLGALPPDPRDISGQMEEHAMFPKGMQE